MRLGSFIIWRNDHDFVDEDLILVEIASTVVKVAVVEPSGRGTWKKRLNKQTLAY